MSVNIEEQKRRAGRAAAALVASGMRVGLGTGSTARHVVIDLGRRLRAGEIVDISGIPTSQSTAALAAEAGIPLTELGDQRIDLAIDGADEIAPDLSLIKGGGGALLREKIVAQSARSFVVVADSSKLVTDLGVDTPVPVEIAPFGHRWTMTSLSEFGVVRVRMSGDDLFTTDNGNLIADLRLGGVTDLAALDRALTAVPGVLATGIFCDMTTMALVADETTVRELRAERHQVR